MGGGLVGSGGKAIDASCFAEPDLMRFAIISDIHGNMAALEAVARDLESTAVEEVYAAGDLALFGPRPRQCVAMLQQNGWASVRGNTDRMIADFDGLAAEGSLDPETGVGKIVAWTREQLGRELVEYLGALPPSIAIEGRTGAGRLSIFHGTPRSDEEGLIEDDGDDRLLELTQGAEARAIIGGHTHKSFTRRIDGTLIANAGSVGRSYEGRPGYATYLVLDDGHGAWTVEIRQVGYDHMRNYRAIEEVGAPIGRKFAEPFNTAIAPS